jgi:hypothetical protein
MIEARASSALLVSAMIRTIQDEGGSAMVLAKGDAVAGAILLAIADRGDVRQLVERVWQFDGGYRLEPVGPADLSEPGAVSDYIARRRRSDPDLWAIELDHHDALAIAGAIQS